LSFKGTSTKFSKENAREGERDVTQSSTKLVREEVLDLFISSLAIIEELKLKDEVQRSLFDFEDTKSNFYEIFN
jgi:hypothetical protein